MDLINNLDNIFRDLNGPQDLLDNFDARVKECGLKLDQVEHFVEKSQKKPSNKLKTLMTEVLEVYAQCATDYMIQVKFDHDELQDFQDMLRKAPKYVGKVAYLPGKLLTRLSKIVDIYSDAFGGFRRWVDLRERENLAEWKPFYAGFLFIAVSTEVVDLRFLKTVY
ncbi:uncharacterized protein LOC113355664 [Papaver somniferum]|nr:uncharacterized protein LOC113355664 [Papaver somniferum]XP_026454362.1 uncharacterized protein LOC113355664 [Papaver somniferum]